MAMRDESRFPLLPFCYVGGDKSSRFAKNEVYNLAGKGFLDLDEKNKYCWGQNKTPDP
jgi:hypothetical protein